MYSGYPNPLPNTTPHSSKSQSTTGSTTTPTILSSTFPIVSSSPPDIEIHPTTTKPPPSSNPDPRLAPSSSGNPTPSSSKSQISKAPASVSLSSYSSYTTLLATSSSISSLSSTSQLNNSVTVFAGGQQPEQTQVPIPGHQKTDVSLAAIVGAVLGFLLLITIAALLFLRLRKRPHKPTVTSFTNMVGSSEATIETWFSTPVRSGFVVSGGTKRSTDRTLLPNHATRNLASPVSPHNMVAVTDSELAPPNYEAVVSV